MSLKRKEKKMKKHKENSKELLLEKLKSYEEKIEKKALNIATISLFKELS